MTPTRPANPLWLLLQAVDLSLADVAQMLKVRVSCVSQWKTKARRMPPVAAAFLTYIAEAEIGFTVDFLRLDRLAQERFIGEPLEDAWLQALQAQLNCARQLLELTQEHNRRTLPQEARELVATWARSQKAEELRRSYIPTHLIEAVRKAPRRRPGKGIPQTRKSAKA